MTAIEEIAAERRRQIEVEGWTAKHGDGHTDGSLANAAASYTATNPGYVYRDRDVSVRGETPVPRGQYVPRLWPRSWANGWWKPKSRRENLIKAGALIVAEIERLDRAEARMTDRARMQLENSEHGHG